MSEASEQAEVIKWAWGTKKELGMMVKYPCLEWLYGSLNGVYLKGPITKSIAKSQGMKQGVTDLNLDVAKGGYHGLKIEMKLEGRRTQENGGLEPKQVRYRDFVVKGGYFHAVCYDHKEAIKVIENYLNL